VKKFRRVAADHFVFFFFRHAGKVFLDDLQRLGPVGFLVRKIRAPHQSIDVDLVAQLDADPVELKPPVALFADVFARRTAERFEAEQTLRPTMMAVVAHVGGLQEKGNPADLVLCEENAEGREAVEETG
jgi:hypothetical protein